MIDKSTASQSAQNERPGAAVVNQLFEMNPDVTRVMFSSTTDGQWIILTAYKGYNAVLHLPGKHVDPILEEVFKKSSCDTVCIERQGNRYTISGSSLLGAENTEWFCGGLPSIRECFMILAKHAS